jgi:hypothetical protein
VNEPLLHAYVAEPVYGVATSVAFVEVPLLVAPAVPEQLPHVTVCEVQLAGVTTQLVPFHVDPLGQLMTTCVHGPQLLPSFVFSLMTPVASAPELLSAQARR